MSKRPSSVTFLAIIVLLFVASNWIRVYETLFRWDTLTKYNANPGPVFLLASGLAWILFLIPIAIGLVFGKPRTPIITEVMAVIYSCWFWIDRVLLQHRVESYFFPLLATAFMLLFVFLVLNHRDTKYFFREREKHDR